MAQENKSTPPSDADLAAVSSRGRMMAAYDASAWRATDAVSSLNPDKAAAPFYIARKSGDSWEVAFGRLSSEHDRFTIVYLASQAAGATQLTVKKFDPPREDRDFYLRASEAIYTASRDFGRPERPYNTYAIPSGSNALLVYFLPAQTKDGVYPLGADVRYTLTSDGNSILEKRQMHKSIVEGSELPAGTTVVSGMHKHELSNTPEDSDVFYAMTRKPARAEGVATPDQHTYEVHTDGSIKRTQ